MVMDINEIREYLPHRYPFLLVDRVTELTLGETIVAYKNVSINEPFFNGHFPHHPIMPGVLVVEALAQQWGEEEEQRWRQGWYGRRKGFGWQRPPEPHSSPRRRPTAGIMELLVLRADRQQGPLDMQRLPVPNATGLLRAGHPNPPI